MLKAKIIMYGRAYNICRRSKKCDNNRTKVKEKAKNESTLCEVSTLCEELYYLK